MNRHHVLATDVIAAAALAATAVLLYGESYRRGVDLGTLGLGMAALGLFVMLGGPWQFLPARRPSNLPALAVVSLGFVVGLVFDLVFDLLLPISLAWSALLWAWLSSRLPEESLPRVRRLLLLTLLVFPWADLDIKPVHWAMRISAASVSQHVLTWCGLPTTREGTMLSVAGHPVEISEDCAGGETLHAMLAVGLAAAFVYLERGQSLLPWLPALGGFAWLANTLRVLLVSLAVGGFPDSPYVAWVHDAGGWLVVALMLALCIGGFAGWNRFQASVRARRSQAADAAPAAGGTRGPESLVVRVALWSLLGIAVTVGTLWRMFPLADAQERLQQLPAASGGVPGREVPLTESEIRRLGGAQAVKRAYRFGGREFLVTVIDGTQNRRAVHDPMFCWTITQSTEVPLAGGSGTALRVVENGQEKEVLFWFSDGVSRHASPARYWLQASWRRATLGKWGGEPLLFIVESLDAAPVNWFRVLDGMPWLLEL